MALSRRALHAARQSADRASEHAQEQGPWPFCATVSVVTPGAARDGAATVAVEIRDADVMVSSYPDTWTPAVGHRVLCAYDKGHQLFVIQRNIGAP